MVLEEGRPPGGTRRVRLRRRVVRDRKREVRFFLFLLTLVFVVFLATLRYLVAWTRPPLVQFTSLKSGALYYRLKMPRTEYRRGEPVEVELSVRNIGSSPVELDLKECDFAVEREVNLLFVRMPLEVWHSSAVPAPGQDRWTAKLLPGEEWTLSVTWNQEDSRGRLVPPGRYLITGMVRLRGEEGHRLQLRGATEGGS